MIGALSYDAYKLRLQDARARRQGTGTSWRRRRASIFSTILKASARAAILLYYDADSRPPPIRPRHYFIFAAAAGLRNWYIDAVMMIYGVREIS